jgi:hypothetical protein
MINMEEDFGKMISQTDHQTMQARQNAPLSTVGVCSLCGRKFSVSEFHSKVNLVEFVMSGLCQKCQDETAEEGK